MRWLLDINVLIALFDPDHAFHDRAHEWWGRESDRTWASCPLTENGLIRIMASPKYPSDEPFTVAELADNFRTFSGNTDHEFWPDAISLTETARFRHDRILSSRHLTDLYLLALAAENGGGLATFDQGISVQCLESVEEGCLEVLR
jgi:toxin-antitoxin system PIN domain toxin